MDILSIEKEKNIYESETPPQYTRDIIRDFLLEYIRLSNP